MSTATDMLAAYLAAEAALLQGKETRWNDRMLRLEDLPEIRAGRREWEARVASEAAAGASTMRFATVRLDK